MPERLGRLLIPLFLIAANPLAAQAGDDGWEPAYAISFSGGLRVVFPASRADSVLAESLREVWLDLDHPLPPGREELGAVTIAIATGLPSDVEARAQPLANAIALSEPWLRTASRKQLSRTLRHEFAHLWLHSALGHRVIPRWFDEGVAEWAAGPISCASWVRLYGVVREDQWPPNPVHLEPSPTSYDIWRLAIEVINDLSKGWVDSGRFVQDLTRTSRLVDAIRAAIGEGDLWEELRRTAHDRFDRLPARNDCEEITA